MEEEELHGELRLGSLFKAAGRRRRLSDLFDGIGLSCSTRTTPTTTAPSLPQTTGFLAPQLDTVPEG